MRQRGGRTQGRGYCTDMADWSHHCHNGRRREVRQCPNNRIAQLTKLDRRPFLLSALRWPRTSLLGVRKIPRRRSVEPLNVERFDLMRKMWERETLKWWMRDSMLSFIDARGGGTSL